MRSQRAWIGIVVVCLLAGRARADDATHIAAAWWDAAPTHKVGAVDFSVNATIEIKPTCAKLHHGKASDKPAQQKLHTCVDEVKHAAPGRAGTGSWPKRKDVATTNSSLKPAKTDKIAGVNVTLSGIDLTIYIASDPKGVVRRVWVSESYFE